MTDTLLPREKLLELLKEASDVFRLASSKTKILATLSWSESVAQDFFKHGATRLPEPVYNVDKKGLEEALEALRTIQMKISGKHPVLEWLQRTYESFENGIRLLQTIETPEFFKVSAEVYGSCSSPVGSGKTTMLDLAVDVSGRMVACSLQNLEEKAAVKTAQEFAADLEMRLSNRKPYMPVRVEITPHLSAKIAASATRIRIRENAEFSLMELDALWNHEVESHCLTGQNGMAQKNIPFLSGGGPRTTRTQEGIAVFYEIFGHSMSQMRFIRLCNRIEAIHNVEKGADFIELYRWFLLRSETPQEAFYDTQRIFRGAILQGRYPFTKDAVYLAGLLEVYQFLQSSVRIQDRILVESLVTGRIALEDVGVIAWLRLHGIVDPPAFIPGWLSNWEALLSFFSFFSVVLNSVDMTSFDSYLEAHRDVHEWKVPV